MATALLYMLRTAYNTENAKYDLQKTFQLSGHFYERHLNYDRINQLVAQLTDSLNTNKKWDYRTHQRWIDEELKQSCFDYAKLQKAFIQAMHPDSQAPGYQFSLAISKFHLLLPDNKIHIYDNEQLQKQLFVYGNTAFAENKQADASFFYKGGNYYVQVVIYVLMPGLRIYLLRQISQSIVLAILIFIILSAISIYTFRMLSRQFELNELKDDFINNMTHELKTPLTTAKLALKNLSLRKPELKADMEILERQNKRLDTTLDRIMGLSLLNAAKPEINKEEVCVHHILNDLYTEFALQIDDLLYEPDEENLNYRLPLDVFYFRIMLSNLLDNAAKYAPNTRVILKYQIAKEKCVISISDQGEGIPTVVQKMVFTKFYRVPTGNIHTVKGSGLGLFYVDQIAKGHGAKVELISSKGKGSKFKIYFN